MWSFLTANKTDVTTFFFGTIILLNHVLYWVSYNSGEVKMLLNSAGQWLSITRGRNSWALTVSITRLCYCAIKYISNSQILQTHPPMPSWSYSKCGNHYNAAKNEEHTMITLPPESLNHLLWDRSNKSFMNKASLMFLDKYCMHAWICM